MTPVMSTGELSSDEEYAASVLASANFDTAMKIVSMVSHLPNANDSWDVLRKLYREILPDRHAGLVSWPASAKINLPGFSSDDVLHFNFDEGHAGRLTVFGTNGGSIDFESVFGRVDGLDYMKQHLSCGEQDSGEYVVFCPGLNSLHQQSGGGKTTPEYLEHYVKVLGFGKVSQLHGGTAVNRNSIRIDVSRAKVLLGAHSLLEKGLASAGISPVIEHGHVARWDARQIDNLQLALSIRGVIDTPLKKSLRLLFESSKKPQCKPVVIIAYSRATAELASALKQHVKDSKHSGESHRSIKQRLRDRITVVTVGNVSRDYEDGPAYIHLSCTSDQITMAHGVSVLSAKGAGEGAVFLECQSPFHPDAFDQHNFAAVTVQYLSVIMRINKLTRFRDLFDRMQTREKIFVRQNIMNLHFSMIQLTRGYQWLWNPPAACKDIMNVLPQPRKAEALLRKHLGEEFVRRILQLF